MNTRWRDEYLKLLISGCGTQIGFLLTCGLFAILLAVFAVCGLTSALSIAFNTNPQDIASETAAEPFPDGEANSIEAPPSEAPLQVVAAQGPAAPAVQTEIRVVEGMVTTLPETGNNTLLPDQPSPIVTANQGRVNLRIGPGTEYPLVGRLPNKASLQIVGRNPDSTWWLVSTTIGLVWVYDGVVATANLEGDIPIIQYTTPPDLAEAAFITQGVTGGAPSGAAVSPAIPVQPPAPVGTPTPGANVQRIFVEQTVGWKRLREQLIAPPVSASFSPNGDPIAITEGVKLHLVAGDASYSKELLDSNEIFRISGDVVWSPDGEYLAFVVDYKAPRCRPCRSVGLVRIADESITFLGTPDDFDSDAPRWTQDGRLLVNVHPSEPADGVTYLYDVTGRGQKATGLLQLSSSHEGQKWLPWQPGRSWRAGVSERPDTYYQ